MSICMEIFKTQGFHNQKYCITNNNVKNGRTRN